MGSISRHLLLILLAGCVTGDSRHIDVVASAAFERAMESGDRSIFTGLLDKRYRGSVCSIGPKEFSCQEQAELWLSILHCREQTETEQFRPSHEELAALLLAAIQDRDPETLAQFAACDFITGPCSSDATRTRLPTPAIIELLAAAPPPKQLLLAQRGEQWADYTAEPEAKFHFQLEHKVESAGWGWSGYCWSSGE